LTLEEKQRRLAELLLAHGRVAVAFSGGVDSSLLLGTALDVLGAGNVLALHGASVLEKEEERDRAVAWGGLNGYPSFEPVLVSLYPLKIKPFVQNGPRRCYHCKLAMYKEFLDLADRRGFPVLADGTNTDDLKERRPGLRAIRELGVATPLVEAGLTKSDIRHLARRMGLANWDAPAASCLATRIPHGMDIDADLLGRVARYESGLEELGFSGSRARLVAQEEKTVVVQLRGRDFERFARPGMRVALLRLFQKMGIDKVLLDLEGR